MSTNKYLIRKWHTNKYLIRKWYTIKYPWSISRCSLRSNDWGDQQRGDTQISEDRAGDSNLVRKRNTSCPYARNRRIRPGRYGLSSSGDWKIHLSFIYVSFLRSSLVSASLCRYRPLSRGIAEVLLFTSSFGPLTASLISSLFHLRPRWCLFLMLTRSQGGARDTANFRRPSRGSS